MTGPCGRCTRRTWAAGLICSRCQVAERRAVQDDIALTDGAWQLDPKRRIQVWVPGSVPKEEAETAALIACPVCRARIDEWCTRTTTGQRMTHEHTSRLVTRHCTCGNELQKKGRKRCAVCALEQRRKTWREHGRRKRSRTDREDAA